MIISNLDQGVLWLTFNRAGAANALNQALYDALHLALRQAVADPEVKSIVLTGEGQKAFCAGADVSRIGWFNSMSVSPPQIVWPKAWSHLSHQPSNCAKLPRCVDWNWPGFPAMPMPSTRVGSTSRQKMRLSGPRVWRAQRSRIELITTLPKCFCS